MKLARCLTALVCSTLQNKLIVLVTPILMNTLYGRSSVDAPVSK